MHLVSNKKGQGMMEYMIISALVGIFCLTAMKQFGESIQTRIDQMKRKITQSVDINL